MRVGRWDARERRDVSVGTAAAKTRREKKTINKTKQSQSRLSVWKKLLKDGGGKNK